MDEHEWPCRIKSARRKRRLVKTDRDKQLIQLNKRLQVLHSQQAALPWIELEHPYQSGWKRFFVLREDLKNGPQAAFYEALLKKLNTVQYSTDKSFRRKKRGKKRYGFVAIKQSLNDFSEYWWNSSKMNLSDEEKACFTRVETYHIKSRCMDVKYVVTDPWRYVLKIAPRIITHHKVLDIDIERELAWIDVHIDNHYLMPRIDRLVYGRGYNHWRDYEEHAKYINNFKNIPRYAHKEAYLELET